MLFKTAKATKTPFYWAMRNNDGTDAGFQRYLLNIVDHYQVCRCVLPCKPVYGTINQLHILYGIN